jgi:preprotein translocase subunit SecG
MWMASIEEVLATIGTVLLAILGVAIIMLVLIQRGRGQGLAGAFGGMGGASLLGTKAGTFIGKVTGWMVAAFIVLAIALNILYNSGRATRGAPPPPPPPAAPGGN